MMKQAGLWLTCAMAAVTVAACGGSDREADSDAKVLHRGNTAEPLTLDPHKSSGTWENTIIGDMFIGLFTEDAGGEPVFGIAESYAVSDDGLVWTFELRDATWSDGTPVTANDFVFAFRRLLDPETVSQYASVQYLIKNAEAINNAGADPETLGVRAIDDKTLEFTLEYPAPYLPGLLTHYTAFPVPAHVIEEVGDDWTQPENIEVNGAYKLVEWRTIDFVHVERNEAFFDDANVCIDEVYYYPTTDTNTAARRVRNGELDVNSDFPGQQYDRLRQEIPDYVRTSPYLITEYLSFNMTREPFDDVRVRRALSMAVDREFVVAKILRAGQVVAEGLMPPGIAGYEGGPGGIPWADLPLEERRERARTLLEEAGFGPDNPLRFEYTHRNSRDNPRIAPVLQSDWGEIADWVEVDIATKETQIHYANLRSGNFQVADGGWVADFNDAQNFLFLFESNNEGLNYPRYNNPQYDQLVAESNLILDPAERAAKMRQAELVLLGDAPIAPMWHNVSKNLVNPRVTGWVDNVVDIHRTRYLCFTE